MADEVEIKNITIRDGLHSSGLMITAKLGQISDLRLINLTGGSKYYFIINTFSYPEHSPRNLRVQKP
jgi:hypothetical protein